MGFQRKWTGYMYIQEFCILLWTYIRVTSPLLVMWYFTAPHTMASFLKSLASFSETTDVWMIVGYCICCLFIFSLWWSCKDFLFICVFLCLSKQFFFFWIVLIHWLAILFCPSAFTKSDGCDVPWFAARLPYLLLWAQHIWLWYDVILEWGLP